MNNLNILNLLKKNFVTLLVPVIVVGLVFTFSSVASAQFGSDAPPPSPSGGSGSSKTKKERNKRGAAAARNAGTSSQPQNNGPTVSSPVVQSTPNSNLVGGTPRPVEPSTPAYVPPPPPPTGNIVVVSYLNVPGKKGYKNKRLGNVKVNVKRTVGGNFCANRKNKEAAKTNAKGYLKRKNGDKVLVRGTAHFVECNAGEYEIEMVGRDGYRAVKGTETKRKVTLNDDETITISFVLNKVKKKK